MPTRPFGTHDLSVSEVGLGCASWWGKALFDEGDAVALVHRALDAGVTVFDTGASYSEGNAEPRLGRALAGQDKSGLLLCTKAGSHFTSSAGLHRDFGPDAISASIERSLRNLGVDCIPLLQLHGPEMSDLTDPLLERLAQLRRQGKFRFLGLNSFDAPVLDWAIGRPEFDAVMLDYNVLRPEREATIQRAHSAGKAVLAGMPLAMGHIDLQILKIRRLRDIWYAARGLVKHRNDVLLGLGYRFLGGYPDWTAAQAALGFVLNNPMVSTAVFGTTRLRHLDNLLTVPGRQLPNGMLAEIAQAQGRNSRAII